MAIVTRTLPLLTFQRPAGEDQYIALSIRHPVTVPWDHSWGRVCCLPPQMGQYLTPSMSAGDKYHPWVDFCLDRPPHPLECRVTRIQKLRMVVTTYNRDYEQLVMVNGGTIFSLIDLYLNGDRMVITEYDDYPISVRGGYEPHVLGADDDDERAAG